MLMIRKGSWWLRGWGFVGRLTDSMQRTIEAKVRTRGSHSAGAAASLGLFLLALLPRAIGLGAFATADEAKWVYRSAQFLGALLRGDLAGTVVNLTPGVTTTWLGSLGLTAYYGLHRTELAMPFPVWLASLPEFRADLDVLVAVRWPMVLLTSASVVAFYHLARRLVDGRVSLLFALLLAFDPHFIALSRVLGHDAPAGVFIGLSLLAFLKYQIPNTKYRIPNVKYQISNIKYQPSVGQDADTPRSEAPAGWRWLISSGALAGLAWLSKSPAFFLAPFVGLVALVEAWRRGISLRPWLLRLGVWGGIAWLVFVLVWPAGWQDPLGTPYAVVYNAFLSATDKVEAAAEGYWQVPELGLLYYLVNGAFKLSPLAILGLLAWLWLTLVRRRKASPVEWWLLAFAVLFTIFMTLGGKRSNRYILPVWPALYLLAATGLAQISESANQQIRNTQYAIRGVFLLLLVLPTLTVYPYYFSYFNPLLGGPLTAPRLVKIGWGEGLDQVGRWLSDQPDAPALRVGSYYASALAPFFSGKISDVTAGGLDCIVLYRKQVQGGYPSPTILRYFEAEESLHTVRLAGIEYAWVYPGPAMQPALANEPAFPQGGPMGDIGILPKPLVFRPSRPYLPIGQVVTVDVLWLAGDDLPTAPSRLTMQPADDLTRRPGERSDQAFAEGLARLERQPDGLVISRHKLAIPADLPRGRYGLLVDGRPLGEVEARQFTLPPLDEQLDANFGGQLRLVGYVFTEYSEGDAPLATLRLIWQAAPRAWADYTVFLHLVDTAGERLAGADAQPPVPTSQWARDEVVVDERLLPIPDDLPPGDYHLVVGLYRSDTSEPLPLLDVAGMPVGDSLTLPLSVTIVE
jgi:4-amino-4-deoxy-L-arabinose transferase-like glycosyltransferase